MKRFWIAVIVLLLAVDTIAVVDLWRLTAHKAEAVKTLHSKTPI